MYFPLSQITTNLYTNGGEYAIKSNLQPYSGYYWKTSRGSIFTGNGPSDKSAQLLIPLLEFPQLPPINTIAPPTVIINQEDIRVSRYLDIQDIDVNQIVLVPSYFSNLPTSQNYQDGKFTRFFCKKSNELIYIETNKETYDKVLTQDPSIQYQFYFAFNITWILKGDKDEVYITNKNEVELVSRNFKLSKLDQYLKKDYLKYYKHTS